MNENFWFLDKSTGQPAATLGQATYERIVCPATDGHNRGGRRLDDLPVVVSPSRIRDFTWVWVATYCFPAEFSISLRSIM